MLGEGLIVKTISNEVNVGLLNPIISFIKCQEGNLVTVIIKNDSQVKIENVIYLDTSDDYMENSLRKNNVFIKGNPNTGIDLGKMLKNDIIVLNYKVKDNICSASFLCYNYYLNNKLETIYLLNNLKDYILY